MANDLGITVKREDDFTEWYTQLLLNSEIADYSSVSGCIVIRPRGYALWEKIVLECDRRFKENGVKNAYFPLLIPEKLLNKEQENFADFNPLVAWVTMGGNTPLAEKLAVRPTSEAIMYDSYAKWIRSHRDLPLRLNQWNNVVRWEFSHPVPFFRGREFLWNEGHSAFASKDEAIAEKDQILQIYDEVCRDYMALPGIIGQKTEREKFAGAIGSYKIHYYLPNGRIIEGPAFHADGQNFAKAYNVKFKDKNGNEDFVWQNTYAISTRMLGTMLAIHSDNKGLVIPPKMAENKIVILPIMFEDTKEKIKKECIKLKDKLSEFCPFIDDREDVRPGWKYHEWELKGIPLRIELGPKDLEKNQVMIVKRTDGAKKAVALKDIEKEVKKMLDEMQEELYDKADKLFKGNIEETEDYEELKKLVEKKKVVLAPLCDNPVCEEYIKSETSGAKAVFIDPKNKPVKKKKCIYCKKDAHYHVYFGKTY